MADLANARSSAEVLAEMLQASREGPADDVVTELVEQCQTNQSRVMALIDTTPYPSHPTTLTQGQHDSLGWGGRGWGWQR